MLVRAERVYTMALLACPSCGKQISDLAPSCPGCGHPLNPPRRHHHGCLFGCGCLLAAFFACLLAAIIGLLIWIGISVQPVSEEETNADLPTAAQTSEMQARCQANLDTIGFIKEEWATAHDAKKGAVIPAAEVEKLFAKYAKKLICPSDDEHSFQTSYEIGPIGTDPKCKCDDEHNKVDEDGK